MKRNIKGIFYVLALAVVMILQNPIEAKAGHCGGSVDDCGCGTESCNNQMVCWYDSPWRYCDGHDFGDTWTYLSTSATCTTEGYQHWRGYCSICQQWYELYMPDGPLGHDYGSWSEYSDSVHVAYCVRCYDDKYESHNMGGWYNGGDGWYYRDCYSCEYQEKKDISNPSGSISASPNSWSGWYGTVTISGYDEGSGLSSISLYRTNVSTGSSECVGSFDCGGTTVSVTEYYTEYDEGIYYYTAYFYDEAGNSSSSTSERIYLDHTSPYISGTGNTNSDWTNVAPRISVSATDSLSGMSSIVITDGIGTVVSSGTSSASFTLTARYEGIYTWTVIATDNVGHTSSSTVTTKYDITKPSILGTESSTVYNGTLISGYLEDNVIDQNIDDYPYRSNNYPTHTSGLRSVILYKVKGTEKTVIYGSTTKAVFDVSDSYSFFDLYYALPKDEKNVDYYLIIVSDHAGNVAKKKLTSKQSLLTWFHTSIDGSTYR